MSKKLQEYLNLLNLPYEEAIERMSSKYGVVKDDYYRKKSYERFLKGENKTITKGKYSRANGGLYCHHIAENKFLNMSNNYFIKSLEIPYKYQTKDALVYCDLIEHAILHAQISLNTNGQFGYPGLSEYILPMIDKWMVQQYNPKPDWMKRCKDRAFLNTDEAKILLESVNKYLQPFYKSLEEKCRMNLKRLREEQFSKGKKEFLEMMNKYEIDILEYIKSATREELLHELFSLYYWADDENNFDNFKRSQLNYVRDKLEEELFNLLKRGITE